MEIEELIKIQKDFDSLHGWTPIKGDINSILSAINKDIIGIVGELGEFANIIKKINLVADSKTHEEAEKAYLKFKYNLSDEIVDTLIYLLRIISHLDIKITDTYLKKLEYNRAKYEGLEQNANK